MKHTYNSDFSIFGVSAHDNLYVAIPKQFLRTIRQYVAEYQGLSAVPGDKLVSGIFFEPNTNPESITSKAYVVSQSIPINQLTFDSGLI